MMVHDCDSSYVEGIGRIITVDPWKKARPYLKNKSKRAGDMAQVVTLASKCEALSSNHSTSKKKKWRHKRNIDRIFT
jgi:hypothetical protein